MKIYLTMEINVEVENNNGNIVIGNNNIVNSYSHKIPKELSKQAGLASNINFVGREKELLEIDNLLNENTVLLINSIGGIGKSTLASYYFNKNKKDFDYYAFIECTTDIKTSLISAFKYSLNLNLKENVDSVYSETMNKLLNLKGKKLLVIDNIKEIENQREELDLLLSLQQNGFRILFTSRERVEDIPLYPLNIMNTEDAEKLFLKYYSTIERDKVKKLLEYLDFHTLFIELTAKTLRQKKNTLSLDDLIQNFKRGNLPKIRKSKTESFQSFLYKLFEKDKILQENDILLCLKRLSALPSIEISFEELYTFCRYKDKEEFEENLIELVNNGWIIEYDNMFKFHQILKEFILDKYTPSFKEIEGVLEYFLSIIENSADPSIAILNKGKLIYFDSLHMVVKRFDNFRVMLFYMSIGNIFRELSMYKKALLYVRIAIKKIKVLEKTTLFNKEEKKIFLIWKATVYNNLSQVYYALGNYKKVINLDQEALLIRQEVLGDKHIKTIQSFSNLAQVHFSMGNIDSAETFFMKAINLIHEIKEDKINPYLLIITEKANLYSNYSSFLKETNTNDKTKLLSYAKKAVDIVNTSSDNSLDIMKITYCFNLANAYVYCGDYKKAKDMYSYVLERKIELFGKEHADIASAYMGFAMFYDQYAKDLSKAMEYIEKALSIYIKVYPPIHPSTALCYDNKGIICTSCGDFENANKFALKALDLHMKLFGIDNVKTILSYYNVSLTYYNLGNYNKAIHFMENAVKYNKDLLNNEIVVKILNTYVR